MIVQTFISLYVAPSPPPKHHLCLQTMPFTVSVHACMYVYVHWPSGLCGNWPRDQEWETDGEWHREGGRGNVKPLLCVTTAVSPKTSKKSCKTQLRISAKGHERLRYLFWGPTTDCVPFTFGFFNGPEAKGFGFTDANYSRLLIITCVIIHSGTMTESLRWLVPGGRKWRLSQSLVYDPYLCFSPFFNQNISV